MPIKITNSTLEKMLRAVLRIVPILPGPEIYDLLLEVKRSQQGVDAQVRDAIDAIHKTSTLVAKLEESLKEKTKQLEHLRKEHDRYAQLAGIEAAKAEALIMQIEATVGRQAGKERWIAFGINIAAGLILFILGIWLSGPLKHLWRIISP
jgi:hypothetical protein